MTFKVCFKVKLRIGSGFGEAKGLKVGCPPKGQGTGVQNARCLQ